MFWKLSNCIRLKTCGYNSRRIRAVHTISHDDITQVLLRTYIWRAGLLATIECPCYFCISIHWCLRFILSTIPQDVKIIGVTCSSNDAQMHTLSSAIDKGFRYYSCRCRGTMGLGAGNKMFCYIHYWERRLLTWRALLGAGKCIIIWSVIV